MRKDYTESELIKMVERIPLASSTSPSLLCIDRSGSMLGRIRYEANICNQRLDLRLAESVAVGRHQRRLVECGSTVTDDGRQVGVGHFI